MRLSCANSFPASVHTFASLAHLQKSFFLFARCHHVYVHAIVACEKHANFFAAASVAPVVVDQPDAGAIASGAGGDPPDRNNNNKRKFQSAQESRMTNACY
jgi:hypothetical protein